jgi:hypothetical protein
MKKLSVNKNLDGRIELFGIGEEDRVYQNWQTAPNNGWSGWFRMAGAMGKEIAAGRNGDGRLEVFIIGLDDHVYHIWQTAANNGWSSWSFLINSTFRATRIITGNNLDGSLQVFAIGFDGQVYQTGLTRTGWTGWATLGRITDNAKEIALNRNQDGRLEVFMIGSSGNVYHTWQTGPNGSWVHNWLGMGGPAAKEIVAGKNKDGRMEVFTIGRDERIYHIWQTSINNGWSNWGRIGSDTNKAKKIFVNNNLDQRLEIFTIGTNDVLYHFWQTAPNNGWSGEHELGSSDNKAIGLTVGNNQDGRLEVFTIGTNTRVYHFWQTSPNNGWSGEHPLSFSLSLNIIMVGIQGFTQADRTELTSALEIMRGIYSHVGILVEQVEWYEINLADAGSLAIIDNDSEAEDLTSDWSVPNDSLDVFIVLTMNGGADGVSAINGSCDKDNKGWSGAVISLNGNATNSGNTMAHEIGHYLGLDHVPDTGNFIGGNGGSNGWTGIFNWQGDIMKGHCFIHKT